MRIQNEVIREQINKEGYAIISLVELSLTTSDWDNIKKIAAEIVYEEPVVGDTDEELQM